MRGSDRVVDRRTNRARLCAVDIITKDDIRYRDDDLECLVVVDDGNRRTLVVLHSLHPRRHIRQQIAEPVRQHEVRQNGVWRIGCYGCCATLSVRIGSLQWGRTKWQV